MEVRSQRKDVLYFNDIAVLDRKDSTKGQALSFDGTSSSSSGSSLQFG